MQNDLIPFREVAAVIPKANRVCKINYYAVFDDGEAAAYLLAHPSIKVVKLERVYHKTLPSVQHAYITLGRKKVRLFGCDITKCPRYVKRWIKQHARPHEIIERGGVIKVWSDRLGHQAVGGAPYYSWSKPNEVRG